MWSFRLEYNKKYSSIQENQLDTFFNRLKTGEYKVILLNEKTPITKDKLRMLEDLLYIDNISVEVGYDTLKIISNNQEIFLEGLEEISDYEIIAREYLDTCDSLIIKDDEMQLDFTENSFHDIEVEGFYDKCKYITDVIPFIGNETDPVYKMNWDAMLVTYKENGNIIKELWQRE
jgi:hypothetical protein